MKLLSAFKFWFLFIIAKPLQRQRNENITYVFTARFLFSLKKKELNFLKYQVLVSPTGVFINSKGLDMFIVILARHRCKWLQRSTFVSCSLKSFTNLNFFDHHAIPLLQSILHINVATLERYFIDIIITSSQVPSMAYVLEIALFYNTVQCLNNQG